MTTSGKKDSPVAEVRRFLEPGPTVLVSSAWKGFEMIRRSRECYASLECRLVDSRLVRTHDFFTLKVVKAHAATAPRYPRTIHYRGDGVFMISGSNTSRYRRRFRREML